MLSAETASGRYPARSVAVMDRIIREAETAELRPDTRMEASPGANREVQAVAHAASDAARQWQARAIVVYTQTGSTARILSKLKPPCPILAFAPSEAVRRRMVLYWGVLPIRLAFSRNTDRMLRQGERALLQAGLLKKGQRVVVVSGTSPKAGATNIMKLHRMGQRL
jgi:pyruvate kinase